MSLSVAENDITVCPISQTAGSIRRSFRGDDLVAAYASYFGQTPPPDLIAKYFPTVVHEYESKASGLRWYSPLRAGEGDFYRWLGEAFPWYYDTVTWDKTEALSALERFDCWSFLEPGCGDGFFLKLARARGLRGVGVEINPAAIAACQREDLEVCEDREVTNFAGKLDALCALQTIEHVNDPLGFLQSYLARSEVRTLILSAPSHETLTGRTSDPLVWPPHHCTLWSLRAFECLAARLGLRLIYSAHEALPRAAFSDLMRREAATMAATQGRLGAVISKSSFYWHRLLRTDWATRRHSILVVLQR